MPAAFRLLVLLLLPIPLYAGGVKLEPLPPVFSKPQPESLDDLRAIEQQVDKVVAKVSPAVVGIRVGNGSGSGVIISEDGYVLTAGHVSGPPQNDKATIILPNGKQLKAITLGKNGGIDSGLMKITEPGKYPFVDIGKSYELKLGQWVIAIGHPGGFRANRTPVVRVGRLLFVSNSLLRSDCTLVGGDSGGPLFDMAGKVIGIHSRIDNDITVNIHVPSDTYRHSWERLKRGDSWGGDLGRPQIIPAQGGGLILEHKGDLTTKDPKDRIFEASYHQVFPLVMTPGHAYTLDLISPKFDAFLRLEDAKGQYLDENDDGGGKNNSRVVFRPSTEQEYKIVVTSFEGGQTGPFELKVSRSEIVAKDWPTGNVDVLRAIRIPRPAAPNVIAMLNKFSIIPTAEGILVNDLGEPIPNQDILLTWKTGKLNLKTGSQGDIRVKITKDRIEGLALEIPKGMKIGLTLTDDEGASLPAKMNPGIESVPSQGGEIVLKKEGVLKDTDPRDAKFKESFVQTFPLTVKADKVYTLDTGSLDFDAFLRLEDAEGKTLAENDNGAGFFNARIVYRPSKDGEVKLTVTSIAGRQTGAFQLTVRESEASIKLPPKPNK